MLCRSRAQFIFQQFQPLLRASISDIPLIGSKISLPRFSEQTLKLLCTEFETVQCGSQAIAPLPGFFPGDVILVGDLKGSLHNLLAVFAVCGLPPFQQYVFLGDFISSGDDNDFSFELYVLLMAIKCMFPSHITLLRGKNESIAVQTITHGLRSQVLENYSREFFVTLINTFSFLPVAMIDDEDLSFFGSMDSIKVYNDLVRSFESDSEMKEKCLLPLPASYMMNDEINNDDVNEFLKLNKFEKVFLSGQAYTETDSDVIFSVSTSQANCAVSIVVLKEDHLEVTKFLSPPKSQRKGASFSKELHEMKGKNRITRLNEIVKPRIQPQRGYLNLNIVLNNSKRSSV